MTRGHAAALYWSGARSPAGVGLEHGKRIIEVPQELGRTLFRSSAKFRLEIPDYQLQALAAHSSVKERNQRVHPRYRQAKETKCDGKAAGRHSVLIVPLKLANFTPLEPVEESETSIHGIVFRKHDECIEIR